jgi:hypothetical protein
MVVAVPHDPKSDPKHYQPAYENAPIDELAGLRIYLIGVHAPILL